MKNLLRTLYMSLISLTAFATVHQVNSGMFYYTPSELTINVGDTVVWINDGGTHNVNGNINSITGNSFDNPESFDSPYTSTVGATIYTHVFNIEGTYNYDCSVGTHALQGMVGQINVEQPFINECIDNTLIDPGCICTMIYEPVCGCDGELYENPCLATQCFGVTSYVSAYDANGNLIDCSTVSLEGCTDSNADNYNANATHDDGSCSYTNYFEENNCFYCEDFENVTIPELPLGMNTQSLENNYFVLIDTLALQVDGFYTGTNIDAGVGGYFTYIPEHTTFAMTNDDACLPNNLASDENNNCDLSYELLYLPSLDFSSTGSNIWLKFQFFHDMNWGGGDAFVEVSIDGGFTFSDLSGPLPTSNNWQSGLFNLSDYNNFSNVIIRFVWSDNGSWASGFAIDDIEINPLPSYSMEVSNTKHSFSSNLFENSTYSIVPLLQAQNIGYNFSADISNNGLNHLMNTTINTSIESEGFSTSSDPVNIPVNSTSTIFSSSNFYPSDTGIFVANINVSNENVNSESEILTFEVSNYVYARDNGIEYGGFSLNQNETRQIGNIFEFYEDQEIYGISVKLHENTTENAIFKGRLSIVDQSDINNIYFIDESTEYSYNSNYEWINIVFNNPIFVSAGEAVYASIWAEYDGMDTVVVSMSQNFNINNSESLVQDLYSTGQYFYLTNTPMIRLSADPNLTPPPSISPNYIETNNYISLFVSGLPFDTDVRFKLDSSIITAYSVMYYSNSEAYVEINTEQNIGIWDLEYFDNELNSWITLIENGLEIHPGPTISNITPNQINTNSGYTEFEITFSNIGFYFQDEITDWYNFYATSTNGEYLEFYPISIVNDSTILVYAENQINNSSILNNWEVGFGIDWNYIDFSGNLNANIEVYLPSVCDNGNDFISFNNIFLENSDTIKVCENSTISINTYPYSSSNFYWDNNSYSNNLIVNSEHSRILFYSDDDTTCEINSYEFEFIQLDDVAITSITPNTCFGIDDGFIEIFSPYEFIEMGTMCCDEMGNEYIEGYSDYIFSYFTDQISFYDYLDNQNGYTNLTVNNNSNISNIYVLNNYNQNSCIVDLDFDTELNNPQFYTLPFEESFDSGMPCDWSNDSHWSFGDVSDVLGPYWNIPDHNQFAVSNDDACDCDMMQDRLITPPLIIDNLEGDISLSFSTFFTGDYGSIANIEISNDMGDSWQNIDVLTPSTDWQDISINISNYVTSDTIQLAFRHSDSHSWGSGFAIDDVLVDFHCLDSDDDGICDDDEVLGCTNTLANNFNELATEDDGTCQIDIYGCTYISAINFNPEANIDDGSCFFTLNGCTDQLAINFNELANIDDGSCEYADFEDPCDIVPSGLFVDDIIHNRVVFNWSAPSAAPSHYMIRYRVVGTSSWTVMTAGPVNSNEFTGTSRTRYFMEPGTTYEWNIRARVLNEDGSTNCQSAWSASNEYTTLDACANLENLSVSTEAVWATLSADAPAAEWGVWQSKGKMRVVGTNSFRYVNGDENGNISSLKGNFTPSTDYEWHTKAWCTGNVDSEGNSDPMYHSGWGDFSSFTTEAPCDKMPTNLSTSANGAQTAITMSWDTPDSGEPDHYFLELTNVTTGQVWAWNNISGSDNSKTKFGLTAGDYSWRIRGACGTNGTSWATIFSQPVTYTLGGARFDNDIVSDLNVYPNPSRDVFNITFSSDNLQSISIRVVNVIGEEIYNEELTDFDGTYAYELDMSKKSKGVYFLEISSEKGTLNSKMILQ